MASSSKSWRLRAGIIAAILSVSIDQVLKRTHMYKGTLTGLLFALLLLVATLGVCGLRFVCPSYTSLSA